MCKYLLYLDLLLDAYDQFGPCNLQWSVLAMGRVLNSATFPFLFLIYVPEGFKEDSNNVETGRINR